MALKDLLRPNGEKLTLHRRAWSETSNPLVIEARAQTLAIQRLQIWLRLAYSVLALAVLLGYWGFTTEGKLPFGVLGAVIGVLAFVVVVILRTGIGNGRRNVEAMLEVLESERAASNT